MERYRIISLDFLNNEDKNLLDKLSIDLPTPEEIIIDEITREDIRKIVMTTLNRREKIIICYQYHLYGRGLTLRELGNKLRISHERVRQIKKDALKKLKRNKILKEISKVI